MTGFENFYYDLQELSKKYTEKNIPLKIEKDLEKNIIRIYGENITALNKAENGLTEVTELAYTTAEHHPYWNLLYHSSEISSSILERWDDSLSIENINDLEWSLKKLQDSLQKIKNQKNQNPRQR